jgi:hypothetical protein
MSCRKKQMLQYYSSFFLYKMSCSFKELYWLLPFDNKFFINYSQGMFPENIILTDISGRNIRISYSAREAAGTIELWVMDKIEPGIYIIHMRTSKKYIAQPILKR